MNLHPADWPFPATVVNPLGSSDIVLICEHASAFIPAEYEGLGLPPPAQTAHIAWDIGAESLARALSAALDAPLILATVSRLVIDLNRPLDSPESIVSHSGGWCVPGNANLSEKEREKRQSAIFAPFHATVSSVLDARAARATRLVSVHSFTPELAGTRRPWHIGILYGASMVWALSVRTSLSACGQFNVGDNEPYGINRLEDYGLLVHGDDRNLPAILLEIRNDQISSSMKMVNWTNRLANALGEME